MNIILVIFNKNENLLKNKNLAETGLMFKFCDICYLEELDKNVLPKYKAICDCTDSFAIYNSFISKKKGVELTENNFKFIKTPRNNFLIKGCTLTQLYANEKASNSIKEQVRENLKKYKLSLDFILKKIPETRNKIIFEEGISKGIDITDYVTNKSSKSEKVYKLVNEIPKYTEPNTEYLTYENVFILEKIKNIFEGGDFFGY